MRFRFLSLTIIACISVCAFASWAQKQESRRALPKSSKAVTAPVGQLELQTLDDYKANHPKAQFYGNPFSGRAGADDEAGTAGAIYGTELSSGSSPLQSAWNHIAEVQPLLGDEFGGLMPEVDPQGADVTQGVMFDRTTGAHKFRTFRFNQLYNGVPVFRSGVGFLVRNEPGFPLVMSSFDIKQMNEFGGGGKGEAKVTGTMLGNVGAFMDGGKGLNSVLQGYKPQEILVSDEELVIYGGAYDEQSEPELAVSFIASRGSVQTYPDYQKYLVVASVGSGEILLAENQIQNLDVNGSVSGRATNGIGSLECHPETAVPLPYAEASIQGGNTTFADANGNFVVPHGGTSQVTVTSRLRGQYFEVRDQAAGNSIPQISQLVLPPGPANFLHNPTTTNDLSTANVNAYVESNVVRDYVLFYEPTFPVIATQNFFDVNTNIGSTCNAFYDGSSINFYQAGGGCNNTSFSDVVYHEYGHHLINVSGNGQGQMGEGSGDVMGVLIQDEPILGNGFSGNCGSGIRNANNTVQYPCTGAIHSCGQLISGCVWDLRNQLLVTEPSSYRDIGAQLFISMLIVRGQMQPGNSTIDPSITIMYLELDDNDGNIGNGTPHYSEIATAFGLHNMDAPPLQLLEFDYPNGRPQLVPHTGGTAFTVEVLPLTEDPQPGSGVLFVDRGNGFESFPMNQTSPNVYEANFPTSDCGSIVKYYVTAGTTGGNTATDPPQAPSEFFSATIASSIDLAFADDFQANLGWSVSGNALDGQWQRGVPAGGGDRGDPPTDGDGSGACYVTDNADGNSDVDDGSTVLTSPVMDASSTTGQEAIVSYYRWYSNNFGNAPESDIFVVEISNNNGSTWSNLETVGPTGPEVRGGWFQKSFRIADVLPPTNQMRLRFTASDLGVGSVVEAGVDGVEIQLLNCIEPEVVPEGTKLPDGVIQAGQLSDLFDSDDSYMEIDPSPTQNPIKQKVNLILQSTSPNASPNSFGFRVESKMLGGPSGDVLQTVELFNYQTGVFELLDSRAASNSDQIVNISPAGDLSRFVQPGTNEVTASVIWKSESFSGPIFFWSIDVDQTVWTID